MPGSGGAHAAVLGVATVVGLLANFAVPRAHTVFDSVTTDARDFDPEWC
jgi:hypothetical protein